MDDTALFDFEDVFLTIDGIDVDGVFAGECEIDLDGHIVAIDVGSGIVCDRQTHPWLFQALRPNVRRAVHNRWDDWMRNHPATRREAEGLYRYQRAQIGLK
jgi:hypothetical protein